MATFGVIGSRDYPNEGAVRSFIRGMAPGTTVVSGGRVKTYANGKTFVGRGVDVWAADEAEKAGLTVVEFYPDMDNILPPACFHARNKQIAEHVAAATDGEAVYGWSGEPVSKGTASGLRYALRAGTIALVADANGAGPIHVRTFDGV